jgi:hypothetical protein
MNPVTRALLEAHRADLLILDHRGTRVAAARRATRARRTGPEDDTAGDILRSILIVLGAPGLADRVGTAPSQRPLASTLCRTPELHPPSEALQPTVTAQ